MSASTPTIAARELDCSVVPRLPNGKQPATKKPTSGKLVGESAMKISLSPEVERLIAEQVRSGRYHSADEVVREGLGAPSEAREKARTLTFEWHGEYCGGFRRYRQGRA